MRHVMRLNKPEHPRAILFCFVAMLTILVVGCGDKKSMSDIIGKWRSPAKGTRDSEWGPAQFHLELQQDGKIKSTVIIVGGPGGAGTISNEGTYKINGDVLTTDVISRGAPIKYEIRNGHLILRLSDPEEVYEFVREGR